MQLKLLVTQAVQSAQEAGQSGSADAYANAARVWSETEAALREHIQRTTRPNIEAVIRKLRNDQSLTAEEMALVRLWVIGDAESYTRAEQEVHGWMNEVKRLTTALRETVQAAKAMETAPTFHLKALLHDGVRVLWDLHHYLEQQARIKRFQDATQELDAEERRTLIDILVGKIRSPDF